MARSEKQLLAKTAQQMSAGKFSSAVKTAQIGMKSYPKSPAFCSAAGLASAQMGLHKKAADYFVRTLSVAANSVETQDNLVQALVLAGDVDKALAYSSKFLAADSNRDAQHYLRAMAYLQIGRPDLAEPEAARAHKIAPTKMRNLKMLAETQSAAGFYEDAATTYANLAKLHPDETQFVIEQSNMHVRAGDIPGAKDVMTAARELRSGAADMIGHLANLHMMTGDADAAEACFVQQSDIDPVAGAAWFGRASLAKTETAEKLLVQLCQNASQASGNDHNSALMHFGLAELARKTADGSLEESALQTANAIEAARRPYDQRAAIAEIEQLCAIDFTTPNDASQHQPIFILGLPRSGTSLLERMIGAHPDVTQLGEFEGGQRVLNAVRAASSLHVSAMELTNLYLGARKAVSETAIFTDKLPANYKVIGALHAALPRARFIHLTREPNDIALSTWRNYFAQTGMDYAFDINAMAHVFNLYKRYMGHWDQIAGIDILQVAYEDLVTRPQETTQTIAAHCGLTWSDEMARPEASAAAILTASAVQARQKVHVRSVGGGAAFPVIRDTFRPKLDPALWEMGASDSISGKT